MRESSHFDGHQTTGYNLHKNITGFERYASHRIAFPGRYGSGPHMRRYVDRLSIRGGASFLGWPKLTRTAASAAVLPNSHERPRAKQRC
ncbi:hypothetical protein [Bradyrhizobium ottawaense]|uniref:hypothetical protein n=1 Tax=Bradyrhizobium ottawaense TaxID=931866 RepID=UPI0011774D45|nr:hypothetical protein [Bradyrhizobium ottawaense]